MHLDLCANLIHVKHTLNRFYADYAFTSLSRSFSLCVQICFPPLSEHSQTLSSIRVKFTWKIDSLKWLLDIYELRVKKHKRFSKQTKNEKRQIYWTMETKLLLWNWWTAEFKLRSSKIYFQNVITIKYNRG